MRQAFRVGGITFMTGIACAAVANGEHALLGYAALVISIVGGWLAFLAEEGK